MDSNKHLRGSHITATSTESSLAGCGAEDNESSCPHCNAPYGHYIQCPTINRNSAEARSAKLGQEDAIRLKGLGVSWE
jgi:hypothetical protein